MAVQIKPYEIVNWLCNGVTPVPGTDPIDSIPENFLLYPKEITTFITYIHESLFKHMSVISFLNDSNNRLFSNPKRNDNLVFEILLELKFIFIKNNIRKSDIWTYYPNRFYGLGFDPVKKLIEYNGVRLESLEPAMDINDAKSKIVLLRRKGIDLSKLFKDHELQIGTHIGGRKKPTVSEMKVMLSKATATATAAPVPVSVNIDIQSKYLTEMNQNIIDEMELTLFNTDILANRNSILFTFIDKFNKKRYYIEPFSATIYLSKINSIIENDYIEDKNQDKFIPYRILDMKVFNRLKFTVQKNFTDIMNEI